MQKKLIALAVAAAASSSVFADTTFYGRIDNYIASASNGSNRAMSVNDGGPGGSYIAVKADEDLGGGMKAYLNWQAQFKSDDSVTPNNTRFVNVGLNTGAAGSIQLGAGYTPTHKTLGDFQIDGGPDWTIFGQVTDIYDATMTSAVEYIGVFGPVTIDAAYLPSEIGTQTATKSKKSGYDFTVSFAKGAVAAALTTQQKTSRVAGVNTKNSNIGLGASFNAGPATLKGTFVTAKDKAENGSAEFKETLWEVGAEIPVGAKGVAGVGYSTWKGEDVKAGVKMKAAHGLSASYTHNLGKRTFVYAAYGMINNSADTMFGFHAQSTPTVADKTVNLTAVGLRHSF